MKKFSLPRLPLPVICGYIPLARHLTKALILKTTATPAPSLESWETFDKKKYNDDNKKQIKTNEESIDRLFQERLERMHRATEMSAENLKESLGWA